MMYIEYVFMFDILMCSMWMLKKKKMDCGLSFFNREDKDVVACRLPPRVLRWRIQEDDKPNQNGLPAARSLVM
jgi:hypothetical protein